MCPVSYRANLNTSYFTDRQDRYLQFTAQPRLADYCFDFLQAASTFSYSLLPSSGSSEDYVIHWSDAATHPHHIEAKAHHVLSSFQKSQRESSTASLAIPAEKASSEVPDGEDDVLVFPVIQAGLFDIREEERCLSLLFRQLSAQQRYAMSSASNYDGPLVDLTSGYFALYKPYQAAMIESGLACRILAASPKVRATLVSAEMLAVDRTCLHPAPRRRTDSTDRRGSPGAYLRHTRCLSGDSCMQSVPLGESGLLAPRTSSQEYSCMSGSVKGGHTTPKVRHLPSTPLDCGSRTPALPIACSFCAPDMADIKPQVFGYVPRRRRTPS